VWQFHKYKRYSIYQHFFLLFIKRNIFNEFISKLILSDQKVCLMSNNNRWDLIWEEYFASTILSCNYIFIFYKGKFRMRSLCPSPRQRKFYGSMNTYNIFTFTTLKGTGETRIQSFLDSRHLFLLLDQTIETFV
jgi:hypothetical protein